ncbi:glycogen debranching protein [Bifidobacterium thermophilum]|uniref:starch-binding protein n=1 Tax=Bifidobacterium thermophilum TaxID=33905 RepID=UPI000CC86D30|nr:starch-binding protein [Bifidobacterium thermophilum]PKU90994.1 glycogen debranching protein [Bifidobacterium thermophilum]
MSTGRWSTALSTDAAQLRHHHSASHDVMRVILAGVTVCAMLFASFSIVGTQTALAAGTGRDSYTDTLGNADFEAARAKYGLTKDMKNGAILHAWMWSFNTIKNNMKAIAEAGYTSVQTEPMSAIKTDPANGKKFANNWYYVYQPTDTTIGNFVVGTEQDLKDMCAEAHKYGVRIIVDVVANHFTSDWNAIGSDWKDTSLFHSRTNCPGKHGDQINYSNRWQVTHCHLLGLWDINTENQAAANKMKDFLVEAVNDGVDGFRFDAAKHVELPDEFPQHSVYWETILKNGAQYQYGEVLQGDNGLNYTGYTNMFTQYSSDGGGATASDYGKTVRVAIRSSNLNAGNLTSLRNGGAKDDQLVTWVESHDNYANDDKESTYLNDYQLRMGWAIVGSRAGGAPLYFNRPVGSGGNNAQFAEQSQLGDAGDNMWKDKAVVAVNHFRNKMNGNSEYLRNCQSQNSCLMVERYVKDGKTDDDGVVIANMGGDVNLAGSDTTLDDGTYTDQVNGGTITVSGGKITAGTAKAYAVSAFYQTSGSGSGSSTGGSGQTTGTSVVYATKPSWWNAINAYIYKDDGSASAASNASWPGVAMTRLTADDGCATAGTYRVEVPDLGGGTYRVIFSDNGSSSNRYPADMVAGMAFTRGASVQWDGQGTSLETVQCSTPATKVAISGDGVTDGKLSLSTGATAQLTATVTPSTATGTVTWASSSPLIATVDANGRVSALKAGTTTITASVGNVTASVDVTVTASQSGSETKNVVYASKPSGWNALYAYVYTGDGTSAKSNATWPGVAMTRLTADDGCAKAGMYRYEVPDLGTGTYRVIFNDGGSQQTPGARKAGMELKGTMAWTGGDTLNTLSCQTVPPAADGITGDGVADGALAIAAGKTVQLGVNGKTVTMPNAKWWSDGAAVAVTGTGLIVGVTAGTSTVSVTTGDATYQLAVTVK